MNRIVFDIETLGLPLESFDPVEQEYLLKGADTEDKREAELQKLSLYPLTARIIAIGMLNPETGAGKVMYEAAAREQFTAENGSVEYASGDERAMLGWFWDTIPKYPQFITFNGRGFDCPFLMLRSAMAGIAPTRNLMPYRYDASVHCDLLEQFTFYGAVRRFNLDSYCRSFGIRSPKSEGVKGADITRLHAEGKFREIAQYCFRDVKATAELFARWEQFLHFKS